MYSTAECLIQGDIVLYALLYDNVLNVITWHLFNLSFFTRVKKIQSELNATILSWKENKSREAALHIL